MENFYLFIGVVVMFIKCNIFIKICQIAYLKYMLSLYTNYISNFYKVLVKSILIGGLWENLKVGNQWECCRHSLGGASHGLNWGRRGNRGGTGLTKEQGWLRTQDDFWLGWMTWVTETETLRGGTSWEEGEMSSDVETPSLWCRCFGGFWTCGSRFQERERWARESLVLKIWN